MDNRDTMDNRGYMISKMDERRSGKTKTMWRGRRGIDSLIMS